MERKERYICRVWEGDGGGVESNISNPRVVRKTRNVLSSLNDHRESPEDFADLEYGLENERGSNYSLSSTSSRGKVYRVRV